jgi:hypothetical protein
MKQHSGVGRRTLNKPVDVAPWIGKLHAEYRDNILTLVPMFRGVMGTLKVISAFSSVTLVARYRSKLCHNTETLLLSPVKISQMVRTFAGGRIWRWTERLISSGHCIVLTHSTFCISPRPEFLCSYFCFNKTQSFQLTRLCLQSVFAAPVLALIFEWP